MSGHADERNVPSHGDVAAWAKTSADLDEACEETGRDPSEIRRSIQLFVPPAGEGHLDERLGGPPGRRGIGHVDVEDASPLVCETTKTNNTLNITVGVVGEEAPRGL